MTATAEERLDFRVAVLSCDRHSCIAHADPADCDDDLAAHHVVTQQQLRKAGRDDLLWDPTNGATVCGRAHRRHHSGRERIRVDRLPQRCRDFAERYGFEHVLDRFYAKEG